MGMRRWGGALGALALVALLVGCGGSSDEGGPDAPPLPPTQPQPGAPDAGPGTPDAGPGTPDAGPNVPDGGTAGGSLGWSRENAYLGTAWGMRALESAGDGSFVVWTYCLRSCTGDTANPKVSLRHRLQAFRADGTPTWTFTFPRQVGVTSLEVSRSGRVVVGGTYVEPPDFGGGPLRAPPPPIEGGFFVLALSPEGQHLWSRGFTAEPSDARVRNRSFQLRVAADDADHLVAVGRWAGPLNLGGETLGSRDYGISFLFAARFDAGGRHLWSRSLRGEGAGGDLSVEALGTDAAGHLALGGTAGRPGAPLGNADWDTEGGEPYALSLSAADGSTRWTRRLEGTRGALTDVARMPEGGLAFAGHHLERGFSFAGQSFPEPRGLDALLLAVTSTGEPRWARSFRGASREEQPELVSDAQGNLTLGVVADGALELGGARFEPRPRDEPRGELYLGHYGADGRHLWSRLVGNHTRFSSALRNYGLGTQPDGSVVYGVQMTRESAFELDGRTFNTAPGTDQLFLQFRP